MLRNLKFVSKTPANFKGDTELLNMKNSCVIGNFSGFWSKAFEFEKMSQFGSSD